MKEIRKTAIIIALIVFISKLLGFTREMLLAYYYGATYVIDAYLTANQIPLVIISGIIMSIATIYIPKYTDIKIKYGNEQAQKMTNHILTLVSVIAIIISIIGFLLSKQIVSIVAPGFKDETLALTTKFLRILFPTIIFIVSNRILDSYLQCNEGFIFQKLTSLISNIVIIISIIISVIFDNIYILINGVVVSYGIRTIILVVISSKLYDCKLSYKLSFKDQNANELIILAIPVFIGQMAQQINSLVDRLLASWLIEGSISALNYAYKLNEFTYGIVILALNTIIFPRLSKLTSSNKIESFNTTLIKTLNFTSILLIPITVGTIVLRSEAVSIVYMRGNFNLTAANLTTSALLYYAVGIIGFGYRNILIKAFYSLHDTKVPLVNGVISVVINIILNLILVKIMQHKGLALSTSISAIISTILLLISIRKKNGSIGWKKLLYTNLKVTIASLIMGVVVILSKKLLIELLPSKIIALIIIVLIGIAIYFLQLIYIFKIEEIRFLFKNSK